MGTVVLGARLILAGVFATAGVAKLLDGPGSRRALQDFGVPERLLPVTAALLPLAELTTAVALIPPGSARWGAVVALILLLGFIAGIANALSHGQAPDCHCFGQLHSAPAGRGTLARNGALATLAGLVIVEGPGPSIVSWVDARIGSELVATATAIAALLLAALSARLWSDNRKLRDDLAEARADIATLPAGLPVGASAPKFTLATARGEEVELESLCERGHPVVLVFVTPGCGPCQNLFGDLGRWQTTLADRLTVAVISSGTANENLPAAREHGITDVLLQKDSEVMSAYRMATTPAAVIVTSERRIASTPAEGAITIEPLVRLALRRGSSPPAPQPDPAQQAAN